MSKNQNDQQKIRRHTDTYDATATVFYLLYISLSVVLWIYYLDTAQSFFKIKWQRQRERQIERQIDKVGGAETMHKNDSKHFVCLYSSLRLWMCDCFYLHGDKFCSEKKENELNRNHHHQQLSIHCQNCRQSCGYVCECVCVCTSLFVYVSRTKLFWIVSTLCQCVFCMYDVFI